MKRILTALWALLVCMSLGAQSLKVEAPNLVALNEQFTVTFVVEGENKPSDFNWTPSRDFQLVWGPQTGYSSSIQIINGKQTKSVRYTYTYILLPKSCGKFTLSAATATVKGTNISSSGHTVEVVSDGASANSRSGSPSSSQQSQGNGSTSGQQAQTASSDVSPEDLFMRLSLSRTNVVVGEPVVATLKLYQRVNITGFDDAKFPTFDGFWSQDITPQGDIQFVRESLNDKIYNSALIRKWVLIPQKAGQITIDPAELVCRITVRVSPRGNSIFDGFFDDYTTIRKRAMTPALKVNVAALPAGAPASFGGGVGEYRITARLAKDSLATHEASSLVVTVTGKGNVSLLEAPKVNFPPDFEVYDTKTTEKLDKSTGGTTGSKVFEYPFIPRSYGDFVIEPVKYTYYDINSGRYVTLETEALDFKVSKGKDSDAAAAAPSGLPAVPSVSRKGVSNLNEDIRFIRTELPALSSKGSFFAGSGLFWTIAALLLAAAIICWSLMRKMAARKADVVGAKTRKATKMAMGRLKLADNFLKNNLYTAFYEELHKALLGFISDKLNMQAADLSKDSICTALHDGGVSSSIAAEFVEVLDACEYARYAPDAGHDAMEAHYQKALNVISSIDSVMKGKKTVSYKALTVLLMVLVLPAAASAQNTAYPDSLWNQAAAAYTEGRWDQALSCWQAISDAGVHSPELYCNMGDAWFRQGNYAKAILFYERSLKLDPSYADARYNLDIAGNYIQDDINPVPEFILKTLARKLCYLMDSNAWAVAFLILLAVTLACILLFLLSGSQSGRKTGFFSGIVALLLAIAALSFSFWQKSEYMRADSAIVTRPVTSVKSSPSSESSSDLFILHEGTKVMILDNVGEWTNIELADGRQGWLRTSDLEVI